MEKMTDAPIRPSGAFAKKLENFWYHNKFAVIVAVCVAVAAAVILSAALSRERYDAFVLYAGDADLGLHTASQTSDFQRIRRALTDRAADRDGNGEVSVNLQALFVMTPSQIEAFNDTHGDDGTEVNIRLVQDNTSVLQNQLLYSDYYILLLSEPIYRAYGASGTDNALFADLSAYAGEGVTFFAEDAVLLSSTAFGRLPGVKNLPADTVICFRKLSEFAAAKEKNREIYAAAEDILREMLCP